MIVDAYHDSDKGGTGILWGLVYAIGESLKKLNMEQQVEIEIVYRFSEDDPRYATASRHTSARFPELKIVGSPIATYVPRGKAQLVKRIFRILRSFFVLCFPNASANRAIRAIRDADIVVSKGGHFYRSSPGLRGLARMYASVYSLLLCARLNKRYFVISHTVGPLYWPSTSLLRYVFNKAHYVSARESISQKILQEIGVREAKVTPDTAFYLPGGNKTDVEPLLRKYGLRYKDFAVLVARYWNFPHAEGSAECGKRYRNYIAALANTADYLIQNYVEKVALVVHTMGDHDEFEDDGGPIAAIYDRIQSRARVEVINEDLALDMLLGLYHSARIVIAARLHAVVFAAVSGTPSIAIAYGHKTYGVMSMLQLDDQVVDIDRIEYAQLARLTDELLSHEAENKRRILDAVKDLRAQIGKTIQNVTMGL